MTSRLPLIPGVAALVLLIGCSPSALTGQTPAPTVEPSRTTTTPQPTTAPGPLPLAGYVLDGVEPAEGIGAPPHETVDRPADIALQAMLAAAGESGACDLESQSIQWDPPTGERLDEHIAAAGGGPILNALLWAGSLDTLAASLDAERILLDESGEAGWIVYRVEELPRAATVSRLASAAGAEVWAVGLEVSATTPCA